MLPVEHLARTIPAASEPRRLEPAVQIGAIEIHIERPVPAPPPVVVRRAAPGPKPPLSRAFGVWGLRQG
ncbi:MAG TPA: hypothetical protein VIX89_06765 [Bryobacteraceae bacterium]